MPQVVIPYTPRAAFLPFHNRRERWGTMICHRRAGKTVAAVNDLLRKCAECVKPHGRFAFMAPTRVRAKDIAWQYLKRYAKPIPGLKTIESELAIELPSTAGGTPGRVTLYGADNERAMGLYLDGIVFDECDEIPPKVWDTVRPALGDRAGWAMWMGILRGRHNLWRRYEKSRSEADTFNLLLRASESGILPADELTSMRSHMGEPAYLLQMECDPSASIANAIYGLQMDAMRREGRIKTVAADPGSALYVFFDVGHAKSGDDWAMWLVQLVQRDILLLSYHARTGQIPAYYAAKVREWEAQHGRRVECVYLPHDGKQQDQHGKNTKDYLEDAGLTRIKIVNRTPNLWDSINQLRALMPRVYIDQKGCGEPWMLNEQEMPSGIDALDFYSKKEEAQSGLILDVPVHNQYSHGCDALRTFSEAYSTGMLDGTSVFADAGKRHHITASRDPSAQKFGRTVVASR